MRGVQVPGVAAITAEPHVPVDGETGEAPFAVAVPGRTVAGIAKVPAGSDEVMFIPEYKEAPPEDEAEALPEEKYGVAYYLDMAKTGISKAKGKAKGLTHKVKANVVDKVKAKLFTQKQAEEESDGELSPDSATDNEDALLEETAKRLKAWRGDHNPNKEHPTKTPPAPHSDALVVAEIDYMTGQPVDDPYTLVQELQYSHLGRLAQEAPAAADGMDMDADSQADEDVPENRGLKLREEDLPLLPKWGLMVSATHRTDWMKRYRLATEMGEGSLGEEVAKFKEMVSVMRDFLRAATDHGKAIIEEQFLTPSHRPIPNEIRLTAREGVTSDVFVRSNIWFRVITDRHGMYVRRCDVAVACCGVCVGVGAHACCVSQLQRGRRAGDEGCRSLRPSRAGVHEVPHSRSQHTLRVLHRFPRLPMPRSGRGPYRTFQRRHHWPAARLGREARQAGLGWWWWRRQGSPPCQIRGQEPGAGLAGLW